MPVISSLAYVNLIRHRQGGGAGGLLTGNSEKADVSRNIGSIDSLPLRLCLIATNVATKSFVIEEMLKTVFDRHKHNFNFQ